MKRRLSIVYLDQNYLSNIVKARLGRIPNGGEDAFWHSLINDLKKAVLADKIACPKSEFHMIEAAYDTTLIGPLGLLIDELAGGLEFRPWDSILESQIEDAARIFLGKNPKKRDPWARALPIGVVQAKVIQTNRLLKRKFVDLVQNLLNNCVNGQPHDLSVAIVQEKKDLIERFMGKQALQVIQQKSRGRAQSDRLSALYTYAILRDLWNRLREIGIDTNDDKLVMNFAESELLNTPFIDIFCSIYAAIATHYPSRRVRQGDLFDVPILATVLPYCDVTTTDKFMKEILVNVLHLDNKYKTRILSGTHQDRLVLRKLIRGNK